MKNTTPFWQKNIGQITSDLTLFFQNSWPINWNNFKSPKTIFNAFILTPYFLKVSLGVFTVIFLISLSFFSTGLYQILTTEVAASGGEFREILVQDKIQRLNPVLEYNSEAEKKITNLIYHPLYRVNFPDFSKNPLDKPKITPVLLDREPEWQDEDQENPANQYKSLKFTLKKDLKWSDDSEIKVSDIIYSFERLREDRGNQDFNDLFSNYEMVASPNNKLEFEIRPNKPGIGPNPQLKYLANFSPISEAFYASAKNSDLISSFKSLQPIISSGYFTFPQRVQDPDSTTAKEVENPIRRDFDDYSMVVLNSNSIQNSREKIYLDRYIIKIVDSINDKGGQNVSSLELEARQKKVDIFNRFISPGQTPDSKELANLTGLQQKILPTNTYFSFFINTQPSSGALEGYFVNIALRKFLICELINSDFNEINNKAIILEQVKKILPLNFEDEYEADCSNSQGQLLEEKNTRGSKIYTISSDERTAIKQLRIFNRVPKITMLALEEFRSFGEIIQSRLQQIGLPTTVNWVTSSNLEAAIKQKNYHFLFLPITMVSPNPYPIFGSTTKNVSNIVKNDRFSGKNIETNLKTYSDSNFTDETSKEKLLEFFKTQFVSANLFQSLYEVNFSNRISDLPATIKGQITFSTQFYSELPKFYIQTKRNFR
jgi:ABC-type transport system substrate-binding protein